jgi:NAD(P)-dependent dehydrogenase (short-subunit alcohol dehydrogenase family)
VTAGCVTVGQASQWGLPVWGVVCNAGVGYPMPLELARPDRVREVFEVRVEGGCGR